MENIGNNVNTSHTFTYPDLPVVPGPEVSIELFKSFVAHPEWARGVMSRAHRESYTTSCLEYLKETGQVFGICYEHRSSCQWVQYYVFIDEDKEWKICLVNDYKGDWFFNLIHPIGNNPAEHSPILSFQTPVVVGEGDESPTAPVPPFETPVVVGEGDESPTAPVPRPF
jgi:peptidoglycan/xylan/chitin deacetylase (PgdA/CDA1 family)